MYIQNQSFSDEETLLEQLFDFGLGEPSLEIAAMQQEINTAVLNNTAFQEYKASLSDEEEIMELEDDERRAMLAERLIAMYDSFSVENNKLFGLKSKEKTILFSMDLY